ncbi:MAG: hypothetical protein WCN88_00665 [Candidatus Falkowbacteria bacterium]
MDLNSITDNLSETTDYRLDQRFDKLMRTNPRYKNLDAENRKLIMDLIDKYKKKIREHADPSSLTIRHDLYHLYQNRIKLGLTFNDLDQIKELLESFKK